MQKSLVILYIISTTLICLNGLCDDIIIKDQGYDWPMWRYDANRSAESPQKLSNQLYLQWIHEYPKLKPTWDDPLNQDLMQFGKCYEPVIMGKMLFIGSSASDWLKALDIDSGEEKWTFYADAPIRLPIIADKGKVYFTSDDSYLYCLNAFDGKLIWKFQGSPYDRKILGNERLISTWPARGGAVLKDGIIYFSASIWPFMGIFIYALNADDGKVIWANEGTGPIYMLQPHNSPSYAGVAPQGTFVVSGDRLLVPCGRSVPACFDRNTGKMLYYHLADYNKSGGAFVSAIGDIFINYHRDYVTNIFNLSDGKPLINKFGKIPVLTDKAFYCMGDEVIAYQLNKEVKYEKKENKDKKIEMIKTDKWSVNQLWKCKVDATGDLIKSGNRLYAGGKGVVSAIDIPQGKGEPEVSWKVYIDGTVARIITGDNKLIVVTIEGNIFAFGGEEITPKIHQNIYQKSNIPENTLAMAKSIIETIKIKDGYCLAYGIENADILISLVENSKMNIIALDPDPTKIDQLRRKFNSIGLYGERLSVQIGDPFTFKSPPYLASLMLFENPESVGYKKGDEFFKAIYQGIRPYGGTACLFIPENEISNITAQIEKIGLTNAKIISEKNLLLLIKDGPIPGSADWTHQYGDIANTVKSDDDLVKLPLGLLWFGGSSNMDVLPRHGHGPSEQIIGGRLFIEGIELMNARDVYTGRVLWQKKLPKMDTFGVYYDETYANTPLDPAYNQVHIPGANARGTNFIATIDKVYIIQKGSCIVLDSATGNKVNEFFMPDDPKTGKPSEWGYIGVYNDYLIAGADFVSYQGFIDVDPENINKPTVFHNYDITSSKKLVVMDRNSGKIIWSVDSKLGFRHTAIAVWNNMLFCIDRLPDPVYNTFKRRGRQYPAFPTLYAFDLTNGNILWSSNENIFGTWLSYSKEHNIIIQATRNSRDMLRDEPGKGMSAYNAKDGKLLWNIDVTYGGPVMINKDTIITDRHAYNLFTGKQKMRKDTLTGEEAPWEFKRNYGCNYAIASEHLLTFRSASAGFFDLANDGGTGNFGGFKSGCTANLISANGVLNAPDYTRTCSCSYQNQTSLAMIHDPNIEIWTEYPSERIKKKIKSIGINFGAPGDRMSDDGVLWLEYPIVGGPSPVVPITINPETHEKFIIHSSRIKGEGLKWVTASGVKGISSITISLGEKSEIIEEHPYTIRLYFSEPDNIQLGGRVFDVSIQGQNVLRNFDIVKEAGENHKSIVKEYKNFKIKDELILAFTTSNDKSSVPLICGIEIIAEY